MDRPVEFGRKTGWPNPQEVELVRREPRRDNPAMTEHLSAALRALSILIIAVVAGGCAHKQMPALPAAMLMATSGPSSQSAVAQSQVLDWNAMQVQTTQSGEKRQL